MKQSKLEAMGVQVHRGLTPERVKVNRNPGSGNEFWIRKGEMKVVQFAQSLRDVLEWDAHQVQNGKVFEHIPCLSVACGLCAEEDRDISRRRERRALNLYNFADKRIQIWEFGPRVSEILLQRYERSPQTFTKKTYEVRNLGTDPWYDIIPGEDPPRKDLDTMEKHDLDEYLEQKVMRFYGSTDESQIEEPEETAADPYDAEEEDSGSQETTDEVVEEEEEEEENLLSSLDHFPDEGEEPVRKPLAKTIPGLRKPNLR